MQINPGLSYTRISRSHIQIGSGFRALTISGVSEPVSRFLDRLRDGIPDGHEHKQAQSVGLTELETHTLLFHLGPVLVATPEKEDYVKSVDQDHRGSLAQLRCAQPVFEHGKLQGLS